MSPQYKSKVSSMDSGYLNFGFMTFSQFLARGLSAVKDVFIASFFGTSILVDIYFLATTLPVLFSKFINEPIQNLSLPELTKAKNNTKKTLDGLIQYFFKVSLLSSTVFAIFTSLAISLFKFHDSHYFYIITTVIILMATLPLATLTQVGISGLTFKRDFKKISFLCFINPVFSLISFLILAKPLGEWALAPSLLFGRLTETVFYSFFAVDLLAVFKKKIPRTVDFDKHYRQLGFAGFLLGSMVIINNWIAALCGQGSVAIYNYGTKIITVLISILTTVSIYYFHQTLNQFIVDKNLTVFKKQYSKILIMLVGFGSLISFVLFFASPFIVDFLYNRGKLNPEQLSLINHLQILFGLQTPFFISSGIASKCLSSMGDNRVILKIAILTTILNVFLGLILIKDFGLVGIALSTIFSCFFSFVALNLSILKHFQEK